MAASRETTKSRAAAKRKTARALPRESSRDRLLDSAEALFARRGLGAVGLAEVAAKAELGKASLFHHFPTKAHLYCAVMVRALSYLEVELIRALAEGGPPTARLDRWIDTFIDVLAAHPTYPGLLLRVLADDAELPAGLPDGNEASEAVRRAITTALRLLREGMDCGEFTRMSATHLLQTLIGAIVHPLATGRFGEEWVGESLLSAEQISRRKSTLRILVHSGIVTVPAHTASLLASDSSGTPKEAPS